jgi:hypothetical protein
MRQYETEIEEFGGMFVTIAIDYEFIPGEPMVRYYSDGSGHPGTPDEIHVTEVHVTSVSGETYDKTYEELVESGWDKDLNQLALDYVLARMDYFFDDLLSVVRATIE